MKELYEEFNTLMIHGTSGLIQDELVKIANILEFRFYSDFEKEIRLIDSVGYLLSIKEIINPTLTGDIKDIENIINLLNKYGVE